jgi:hypothetical protein
MTNIRLTACKRSKRMPRSGNFGQQIADRQQGALFELANVLVRFNCVARRIVKANHSIPMSGWETWHSRLRC